MSCHIPEYNELNSVPISIPIHLERAAILSASDLKHREGEAPEVCTLPTCNEKATIVGLDASALTLGECERGIMVAVRAALVSKSRSTKYVVKKFGPIPFLVPFTSDDGHCRDPMAFLEAYIKDYASSRMSNCIILWDGRLQLTDTFVGGLQRAQRNGNVIIALSKETLSRFHPFYKSVGKLSRSFVAILDDDWPKMTVIVRLDPKGLIFKAEYFPSKVDDKVAEDFAKIVSNDLLDSGYPETLRLAHIFCKFGPTEVISLRQAILVKMKIDISRKSDTRKIIFGSLWS